MDEKTRGLVEKVFDTTLGNWAHPSHVEWVREEIPISSFRDLILGWVLGNAYEAAVGLLLFGPSTGNFEENRGEIISMLSRRLPEIVEKIERELGK